MLPELKATLEQIEELIKKLPNPTIWLQCKKVTSQYRLFIKRSDSFPEVLVALKAKHDSAISNEEEIVFELNSTPTWRCVSHKIVVK